jgi:hypothetical protein
MWSSRRWSDRTHALLYEVDALKLKVLTFGHMFVMSEVMVYIYIGLLLYKADTLKRTCWSEQLNIIKYNFAVAHLSHYFLNSLVIWDCRTYRYSHTQCMHSHVPKLASPCYRGCDTHVGKQDPVNFQFILKKYTWLSYRSSRQSVLILNVNKTRPSLKEF